MTLDHHHEYQRFLECLRGRRLPCALIDLDALDRNIEKIRAAVEPAKKPLRIAGKSIRVPWVLDYLREALAGRFGGLMCYAVEEADFLAGEGFDDFLIAYPTVQPSDMNILVGMALQGIDVKLVVDDESHIEAMSMAATGSGVELQAVIDVDMSYRPGRGAVHLGVRRSPIRTTGQILKLVRLAERLGGVRVVGLMGYEAQVAGLQDANPFDRALNPAKAMIRKLSISDVAARRKRIAGELKEARVDLRIFNGGGTGSLNSTPREDPITEVTAGSGFFCPALFSYYRDYDFDPAAFFALQVVRIPAPGMVTCLGGGWIASGPAHADKLPAPYLPEGLSLLSMEGAGEVQTPLLLSGKTPELKIGNPVIFRHAKAGELMEHFNEVLLIRDGAVIDEQPTYRGLGKKFL